MTVPAESDPFEERSSLPDELEAVRITSIEERRGKVLLMKTAGATYSTIADECRVSVATVRKDYQIALSAQAAHWTPERRIMRQSAVLTDVLRFNYPAMMNGDKDAAVTILRALDREAKLFGLDAPQRIIADVNPADFANEASRLISRIVKLDPTEIKELTRVGYQPPQRQEPEQPLDVEEVGDDLRPARAFDFPDTPVDPQGDKPDSPFAERLAARGSAASRADRDGNVVPEESRGYGSFEEVRTVDTDDGLASEPAVRTEDLPADDDLDGWSNI